MNSASLTQKILDFEVYTNRLDERLWLYIQSVSLACLVKAKVVALEPFSSSASFSAAVSEEKQDVFIDSSFSTDKHLRHL